MERAGRLVTHDERLAAGPMLISDRKP